MSQPQFNYTKEMIFAEFKIAKDKDIALSKKKTIEEKENDIHINRIAMLKDFIDLKFKQPKVLEDVDINFNRLLIAYESHNPRDHFYKSVFGKSYLEKKIEDSPVDLKDYSESDKNAKTLEEQIEDMA